MNEYNDTRQPTHGLNLHRKKAAVRKETYVVEFCDVSGDKAFNNVHSACFYGASCAILMFDVTRKPSLCGTGSTRSGAMVPPSPA